MTNYDAFFSRAAEKMKESAIRKMGTLVAQRRDIVSFAPGYPAPETFAWAEFQEIARELLSGRDGAVLQYGPTRGYRPLVECIAAIMQKRGADTTPERLLVTTGSQQGLDLVARVLLDPDDVILVELPTYTGAITAFRNVQATMVGVRQEADGISLEHLEDTWQRLRREGRRIRALYVVPNFQNPTGLLIGLEKRRALLEWADRRDILIVEDDPYRDLYFEDSASEADVRPMRSDDEHGRVIYLSSFSKTLAPGYRVAWIDAPAPIAAKFEVAKQAADLCAGTLDQRVVYEACRQGLLDRQLPILRAALPAETRHDGLGAPRGLRRDTAVAGATRRVLPVGDAAGWHRRRRHDSAGHRARSDLRRRRSILRERDPAPAVCACRFRPRRSIESGKA